MVLDGVLYFLYGVYECVFVWSLIKFCEIPGVSHLMFCFFVCYFNHCYVPLTSIEICCIVSKFPACAADLSLFSHYDKLFPPMPTRPEHFKKENKLLKVLLIWFAPSQTTSFSNCSLRSCGQINHTLIHRSCTAFGESFCTLIMEWTTESPESRLSEKHGRL